MQFSVLCFTKLLFFLSFQAVKIVADYKWSLRNVDKDSEEYQRVKSEVVKLLISQVQIKIGFEANSEIIFLVTVKILKFGTPQTIAIIVLKKKSLM